MAQLHDYGHLEGIINPDDLQLSQEHEENRIQKQREIAQSEVDRIDNQGFEAFFEQELGNGKERVGKLTGNVVDRVNEIIRRNADTYQTVSNGSSASILERNVWQNRKQSVFNRIGNIAQNAEVSFLVADGYENFIGETKDKVWKEWEMEKTRHQEILENQGKFKKYVAPILLGGLSFGLSRIGSKKRRYKRFEEKFGKKMQEQFYQMDKNIQRLKKDGEAHRQSMMRYIQRKMDSTFDLNDKENLKNEITTAIRAGDLTFSLTNFGLTTDQQKIDFLESIQQLDFVKKDVSALGQSKEKNSVMRGAVDSAQAQERELKNLNNIKFKEIRDLGTIKNVPAAKDVPSTLNLVQHIRDDLHSQNVSVEDIFSDGIKKEDLLTESVKLTLLVNAIVTNAGWDKHLSFETKQMLVAWIEDFDKKTSGGLTLRTSADVKKVQDQIDVLQSTGTGSILEKGRTWFTTARALDITKTIVDFQALETSAQEFSKDIFLKKQEFDEIKNDFPEADRLDLEKGWDEVEKVRKFVLDVAKKWKQEREEHQKWTAKKLILENNQKSAQSNLDEELKNPVETDKNAATTQRTTRTNLHAKLEKAQDTLLEYLSTEKGLTSFDFPEYIGKFDVLEKKNFEKTKKNKDSIKELNERIQQTLIIENFSQEIEKKFLDKLEKNDQYSLLKEVSEGTRVTVDYKIVSSLNELKFPDEITGTTPKTFRVFKKNKNAVMLQEIGGTNKILTIMGPAVSGGKAFRNAIEKESVAGTPDPTNPTVGGVGTQAIAFNMLIQ
ncbi:hypothetical protein K9L27_01440 [Candidatus Gracilibacteria bacterium]|nr:hypothetical protein [Candidatus Gracilibacteria bacterium]